MQTVDIGIVRIDTDIFTVQKCLLSTGNFRKLSCSNYAFLHFSEHAKCICRLYPRCDLPEQYFELDSSVLAFRGVEKKLYGFPANLTELLSSSSQQKIKFVQSIQPVTFKKLNFSVVFECPKDAKKWKLNLRTLANIVKNILKLYMITNDCVISLENLNAETRIGIRFIVVHETSEYDKIGRVVGATKVSVSKIISRKWFEQLQNNNSISLGGVRNPYETLKEIVTYHLSHGHLLQKVNLKPCQQVLVAGPPGCGKTSLVRKVVADCKVGLVTVVGSQLFRPASGDTEKCLREVFEEAVDLTEESGTCVLLLDDVDYVCPTRDGASAHLRRIATQLLVLLDQVDATPGLVVVATTSKPHALDSALRRPGRFEVEVYVGVPTEPERCEIVHVLLEPVRCGIPADLQALCNHVSRITPGYVGADLALLCQRVFFLNIKLGSLGKIFGTLVGDGFVVVEGTHTVLIGRATGNTVLSPVGDGGIIYKAAGTRISVDNNSEFQLKKWVQSFRTAVASIRPSSLKSGLGVVTTQPVALSDIGGMRDIKKSLQTAVEWPLLHPEAFSRLGIPHPKGVLLYGPPGCAKTTVVRALATAVNTTFLSVSAAELYSPFVGDAERSVVELFSRARHGAPTILFIDEIDALVGSRGSRNKGVQLQVLSAMLTEMDGVGTKLNVQGTNSQINGAANTGVIVIAATNRPDMLDDALLRPGRFDRLIYVPPPDEDSRLDVLQVCTKSMPLADDVDLPQIASSTELFSGADLANLCREAALCAMTLEGMDVQQVTCKHFQQALKAVKPSLTLQQVDWYSNYKR